MEVAFTKISPKGQVVIPADIRRAAKLGSSDKLIVYGSGDTVILKKALTEKAVTDLKSVFRLIDGKKLGLTKSDVEREIQAVRKNRK